MAMPTSNTPGPKAGKKLFFMVTPEPVEFGSGDDGERISGSDGGNSSPGRPNR